MGTFLHQNGDILTQKKKVEPNWVINWVTFWLKNCKDKMRAKPGRFGAFFGKQFLSMKC